MTVLNLQKPTNHILQLTKKNTKTAQYQLQSVVIPAITAATAAGAAIKISDFDIIGTSIGFADLVCTFLLDENMDSYFEMYKWVKELIEPEKGNPVNFNDSVAEASLFILTNNKTTNTDFIINFHKLWPYAISEIPWDVTTTDDGPMTFTVSFKYRKFDITRNGITY